VGSDAVGSDAGQPSALVQALAWVGERENTEFSFTETHLSLRFRLDVNRHAKLALTQFWCRFGSWRTDQSGLQQVDLSASVHLAFDELEPGDLAFGLAVGPW
jgi:hypothetical protein